eukprot:TRINITY_DN1095_c0_g1_i4.p2 TRINITY_DN1095_c0_g1~~TRINITY_DN1095_c0_g1_i4.p2  ORF type:complete len:628 (-),score=67.88 TRINITY_DN1095_c0_g1_i4:246-2129(-)
MTIIACHTGNGAVAGDLKLSKLREQMKQANVSAYIIPTDDAHMSEYVRVCDGRREFISGFTGSAGTAVVTLDDARLWTDGRYFLQAESELGPEWKLMKTGTTDCPEIDTWLKKELPENSRIGIDPYVHTVSKVRKYEETFKKGGKELVMLYDGNLVDKIWEDRPPFPLDAVRIHAIEYAGATVSKKIGSTRDKMKEEGATALIVSMLDEIAWLTNLRGSDVEFNPTFISYFVITENESTLYIDQSKVKTEAAKHLEASGVKIKAYEDVTEDVKQLAENNLKCWIDSNTLNHALYSVALKACDNNKEMFIEKKSPICDAKAVKNETELKAMRETHVKDAAALCTFLCWLEDYVCVQGNTISEYEVHVEVTKRRAQQPGFLEPSFFTIAGANANGAIIHYHPAQETSAQVDKDTFLLIDSGGQYDSGTTDVTRTFHLGTPTEYQKECFTRVLKGHIALARIVFPQKTPGTAIDVLARYSLWEAGLNYLHGTGHGVGAALNVHEGPISISTRYYNTEPLKAGMICSNEPGYYEDGAFGIRIESLLEVYEAETTYKFGDQSYLGFKPITLVPIQQKMLKMDLLKEDEIQWLNKYHETVYEKVSPNLSGPELDWLRVNTQPIQAQQPTAMLA